MKWLEDPLYKKLSQKEGHGGKEMHNEERGYPQFIDGSVEFLNKHISEIRDVKTWAKSMGFSRSYFCTRFKKCFKEPPVKKLRAVRYKHLKEAILNHPNETSYAIASRIGLHDDHALYKFLSTHYSTNFTQLREQLLREKR